MRIELPSASWADTMHRAEEDAHTLTVATPSPTEWPAASWQGDPAPTLRIEVVADQPRTLILTL